MPDKIGAGGIDRRVAARIRRRAARRGVDADAYDTTHLRGSLATLAMRLSGRRRAAAGAPLIVALVAWFALPTFAASTIQAGDRVVSVTNTRGDFALWSTFADRGKGGYVSLPIGGRVAGYFNLSHGTGLIPAYGASLTQVHDRADVLREAGAAGPEISYILSHYTPVAKGPGQVADPAAEAAAVQVAVYAYTDGALSHPVRGSDGWVATVEQRARAVVADADAHAGSWWDAQTVPDHLSAVTFTAAQDGGRIAHVTVIDAGGRPISPVAATIHWSVSAGRFDNGGRVVDTPIDVAGSAVTHVVGSAGVVVTADLRGDMYQTGMILTPGNRASHQNLVYLRTVPKLSAQQSAPVLEGNVQAAALLAGAADDLAPVADHAVVVPRVPPIVAVPLADPPAVAGCALAMPGIGVGGPTVITPGKPATFVAGVANQGTVPMGPTNLTIMMPEGFAITTQQPKGTVTGQNVNYVIEVVAPGESPTFQVTVDVPATAKAGPVDLQAEVMTAPLNTNPKCPATPANATAKHTTTVSLVPGQVPGVVGAVAGAPAAGPLAVGAPEFGTPNTPVTGVLGEALRNLVVGLCCIMSGLIVLTGIRRNPHAVGVAMDPGTY